MGRGSTASEPAVAERTEIPVIGFCTEKHRLLTRFVDAVKEIGRLQQEQIRSVLGGEPDFDRFEELLHRASQRKDAVKYALLVHCESHQC